MRRLIIFFSVLVLLISCYGNDSLSTIFNDKHVKVLVFLNPECPLCQSYTREIKQLQIIYNDQIDFYGVLPGSSYSQQEMDSFLNVYELPLEIIYDHNYNLVNDLKASITPEVYLIDENNKVQYQGLIDNWLGELGRKRQFVSQYYLKDAIESFINGEEIRIKKTKAIGCFIE